MNTEFNKRFINTECYPPILGRSQSKTSICFHDAQSNNDMEYLRFLVEVKGLDVNEKDAYNFTPLHNADNAEQTKYLLEHGAKPSLIIKASSECGEYGGTPLERDIWSNDEKPNVLMKHTKTPELFIRIYKRYNSKGLSPQQYNIHELIHDSKPSELTNIDISGNTVLHYLCKYNTEDCGYNYFIQLIINKLFDFGLNPMDLKNDDDKTPFHELNPDCGYNINFKEKKTEFLEEMKQDFLSFEAGLV